MCWSPELRVLVVCEAAAPAVTDLGVQDPGDLGVLASQHGGQAGQQRGRELWLEAAEATLE